MNGFHWNAGGWFGGQVGGSLWLLILGILLVPHDGLAAAVVLGAFAATNGIGTWLWCRREQMAAYPAIQLQVIAAGLFATVATIVVNQRDAMAELGPMTSGVTRIPYVVLIVFPALVLQFHLQERAARRAAREP